MKVCCKTNKTMEKQSFIEKRELGVNSNQKINAKKQIANGNLNYCKRAWKSN